MLLVFLVFLNTKCIASNLSWISPSILISSEIQKTPEKMEALQKILSEHEKLNPPLFLALMTKKDPSPEELFMKYGLGGKGQENASLLYCTSDESEKHLTCELTLGFSLELEKKENKNAVLSTGSHTYLWSKSLLPSLVYQSLEELDSSLVPTEQLQDFYKKNSLPYDPGLFLAPVKKALESNRFYFFIFILFFVFLFFMTLLRLKSPILFQSSGIKKIHLSRKNKPHPSDAAGDWS